jgi:flavin-dependent dehydrogenase
MATSIHLVRAGFRVLCLDGGAGTKMPVGESLDWSAPALLAALGLDMQSLIGQKAATYKAKVTAVLPDGEKRQYMPGEWLAKPPYNVEVRTLHVDRVQLDAALRERMHREGVKIAVDRVTSVQTDGRRVKALRTESGTGIESAWFVDASGASALLTRAFKLRAIDYGPKKAAIWAYFPATDTVQGTTLYLNGESAYMEWIWEIPIHDDVVSVGYVASGEAIRQRRQEGRSVNTIFRERLARIPRFATQLAESESIEPNVTSFQCRVHEGIAGPNWVIVGEAASMVDPMTSNGVTAALRTASEAAFLIARGVPRGHLPYFARRLYSKRVRDLGRFFNCGIEKVIYDRAVRARFGVLAAGRLYTVPAWVMNAVYSRLEPLGPVATVVFGFVLNCFRAASAVLNFLCREGAA